MNDKEKKTRLIYFKNAILGNAFMAVVFSIFASLYLFFPRRGGTEPYLFFERDMAIMIVILIVLFPIIVLFVTWIWYLQKKRELDDTKKQEF